MADSRRFVPCRFGASCTASSCPFKHDPDGQSGVSTKRSPRRPATGTAKPCQWGDKCHRQGCWYIHPKGSGHDGTGVARECAATAAMSWRKPDTPSQSLAVCQQWSEVNVGPSASAGSEQIMGDNAGALVFPYQLSVLPTAQSLHPHLYPEPGMHSELTGFLRIRCLRVLAYARAHVCVGVWHKPPHLIACFVADASHCLWAITFHCWHSRPRPSLEQE